jgi:hypothetical protein
MPSLHEHLQYQSLGIKLTANLINKTERIDGWNWATQKRHGIPNQRKA